MLQTELKYFIQHQQELVNKYNGKYIVIVGDKVVGVYNKIDEAYSESLKTMDAGTFFIQECIPGKEAYTQTFNSRVIFA
jgi:hypothetical protein